MTGSCSFLLTFVRTMSFLSPFSVNDESLVLSVHNETIRVQCCICVMVDKTEEDTGGAGGKRLTGEQWGKERNGIVSWKMGNMLIYFTEQDGR